MVRTALRAAATVALASAVLGCGIANPQERPEPASPTQSTPADAYLPKDGLTFTSGASYEMHEAAAVCQPSVEHEDTLLVRLNAPPDYLERRGKQRVPFLYVEAVPGVAGVYELPLDGGGDDHLQDITVFSYHPESGNEFSGSVETSTGTITILEAECEPTPRLAFTIRATLGSEYFDLPSVHVVGGLAAGQ